MLKRLTNWKSTILAIVIFAVCVVLIVKKIATWDQVIGFMTLSGLFAWTKDSVFKVNPDKP